MNKSPNMLLKIYLKHSENKPVYKLIYLRTVKQLIDLLSKLFRKIDVTKYIRCRLLASKIEKDFPDNTVLIFQHSFFTPDGSMCYNGGAERYIKDLAKILKTEHYTPITNTTIEKETLEKTFTRF